MAEPRFARTQERQFVDALAAVGTGEIGGEGAPPTRASGVGALAPAAGPPVNLWRRFTARRILKKYIPIMTEANASSDAMMRSASETGITRPWGWGSLKSAFGTRSASSKERTFPGTREYLPGRHAMGDSETGNSRRYQRVQAGVAWGLLHDRWIRLAIANPTSSSDPARGQWPCCSADELETADKGGMIFGDSWDGRWRA